MEKSIQFFKRSSYQRTISLLVILLLVITLPFAVNFLQQKTNIKQFAVNSCDTCYYNVANDLKCGGGTSYNTGSGCTGVNCNGCSWDINGCTSSVTVCSESALPPGPYSCTKTCEFSDSTGCHVGSCLNTYEDCSTSVNCGWTNNQGITCSTNQSTCPGTSTPTPTLTPTPTGTTGGNVATCSYPEVDSTTGGLNLNCSTKTHYIFSNGCSGAGCSPCFNPSFWAVSCTPGWPGFGTTCSSTCNYSESDTTNPGNIHLGCSGTNPPHYVFSNGPTGACYNGSCAAFSCQSNFSWSGSNGPITYNLGSLPRPPGNNGFGIHWSADDGAFNSVSAASTGVCMLKSMGMTWVKLLMAPSNIGNVQFPATFGANGIEPVVRIVMSENTSGNGLLSANGVSVQTLQGLTSNHVHYIETGNEPNFYIEWSGNSIPNNNCTTAADLTASNFAHDAVEIQQAGGWPVMPALGMTSANGGGYCPDDTFLTEEFNWLKNNSGKMANGTNASYLYVFDQTASNGHPAVIGIHNYDLNNDITTSGIQWWTTDRFAFKGFTTYEGIANQFLGNANNIAILGTEDGPRLCNTTVNSSYSPPNGDCASIENKTHPDMNMSYHAQNVQAIKSYMSANTTPYFLSTAMWLIVPNNGVSWCVGQWGCEPWLNTSFQPQITNTTSALGFSASSCNIIVPSITPAASITPPPGTSGTPPPGTITSPTPTSSFFPAGAACTADYQCYSGVCINYVCAPAPSPNPSCPLDGSFCTDTIYSTDCQSEPGCDNEYCVGDPTTLSSRCFAVAPTQPVFNAPLTIGAFRFSFQNLVPANVPTGTRSVFNSVVDTVIAFLVGLGVFLALVYLVYSGIRWAMSGGNKEQIESAKKGVTYAVVGLVIIALAFVILQVLGILLNLAFLQNIVK